MHKTIIINSKANKYQQNYKQLEMGCWGSHNKNDGNVRNGFGSYVSQRLLSNPDLVNEFFAAISNTSAYNDATVWSMRAKLEQYNSQIYVNGYELEPVLRKLKNTAPGGDDIPAWVYRNCSFELADVISDIFNCCFRTGTVPVSWLTAIVTPVPKVSHPASLSDFRPISVTPVLSRIAEKLIVKQWLRHSIPVDSTVDQYAFKPTGSTTCALVSLIHEIVHMLENNSYVRCIMVDFSKAFDTVDHVILIRNLQALNISNNIYNWIISFLTGRVQRCKVQDTLSKAIGINLSIVQGSGVGPSLYIIIESDLHPKSRDNKLMKCAKDTNLLVPETSNCTLSVEFEHMKDWAIVNKMVINMSKTTELVFHRPHPSRSPMPLAADNIEQVQIARLLGVIFSGNLN